MKNLVFSGERRYKPLRVFILCLNRVNHQISRKNIKHFPQIAIFSFDHIGLSVNLEGRYEAESLNLVKDFLMHIGDAIDKKSVLDIGANIGNHSVFFSNFFERVFAFEPNPRTYKLLEFNSTFKNITPLNFGLSDINGTLAFHINLTNVGGSRIVEGHADQSQENIIEVEVKRLDDIDEIRKLRVGVIKIDVEGHELKVLKGAKDTIEKNKPIILFEQNAVEIVNGGSDVIEFLREIGYSFYIIRDRFYFGESVFSKIFALLMGTFFGFQKIIVKNSFFKQKFHEMIIAVPKK